MFIYFCDIVGKSTNRRTPARKQQIETASVSQSNDVIHLAFKRFEKLLEETKQVKIKSLN